MWLMQKYLKPIIFIGLFAIPFIPFLVSSSFFFPFITTKAFVFRLLIEIIFAAWVLLVFLEPQYRPKKTPVLYAVLSFLLIIGIADLFGVSPAASFWSNFERMDGFITLLHLGALFLVLSSVFGEKDWKRWWNTTLVASLLMVFYCLLQLIGSVPIHQGGVRIDGTLGNATYLAVYMLFHIFIALYMVLQARGDKAMRWLYGILIFGQLLVLYHTATRGAILGLLGGLFIIAILNLKNREDRFVRKASVVVLTALAILVIGFASFRQTSFVQNSPVLSRFTQLNFTDIYQGRYYVWPMALEGIKEHPLLGWGQENFMYIFQKHYSPEMYNLEPWFDRAHNIFLDWAVSSGVLGLLSYLSLYAALLYVLWKNKNFSYLEKSIIAGLVAAYAFHNFFVFDNLISYILFFSLLAYVSTGSGHIISEKPVSPVAVKRIALPAVAIVFLLPIYFWNVKPLLGNTYLIEALKSVQIGDFGKTSQYFQKAYISSPLGRAEVVYHLAANSVAVLESSLPLEKKNEFYAFAKETVVREAERYPNDSRLQILAGSFLVSTGFPDEALIFLERAKILTPGKQQVYFDTGSAYFAKNDPVTGLAFFRKAYDLAPDYSEAKIIYLIGAIYAGDRTIENKLISELPPKIISNDNRIQSAYKAVGR